MDTGVERETLPLRQRREYRSRHLDAGPFTADVASFRLHLAAENKAHGTIRIYTEAPLWFAAAHLLRETEKSRWEQVGAQDVQRWVAWLLGGYSVGQPDRGQGAAGGGDRGGQPLLAVALARPVQAVEPADVVVARDIERVEVDPGPRVTAGDLVPGEALGVAIE